MKKILNKEHFTFVEGRNGDAHYLLKCPFCGSDMKAFTMNVNSRGKRCSKCRALIKKGENGILEVIKESKDEN